MKSIEKLVNQPYTSSVISVETNQLFPYLSRYLPYTSLLKIFSREKISSLNKEEQELIERIKNPNKYNITALNAWTNYIHWVCHIMPEGKSQDDQIRLYVALENFTRTMLDERVFYDKKEYMNFWVYYIDLSRDGLDMLNFLKKKKVALRSIKLHTSIALIYERFHEFKKANEAYLEGFAAGVLDDEKLKDDYSTFEKRMVNRINREIEATDLDYRKIDQYIHDEISERSSPRYNERNKRLLNKNMIFTITFKLYRTKIELYNEDGSPLNLDKIDTVNYGGIGIYLDEKNYSNFSNRCSQIVEIYSILEKCLLAKDRKFKKKEEEVRENENKSLEKKPYSWLSENRKFDMKIFYEQDSLSKENQMDPLMNQQEEKQKNDSPKRNSVNYRFSLKINKGKQEEIELKKTPEQVIENIRKQVEISMENINKAPEKEKENIPKISKIEPIAQNVVSNSKAVTKPKKEIVIMRKKYPRENGRQVFKFDKCIQAEREKYEKAKQEARELKAKEFLKIKPIQQIQQIQPAHEEPKEEYDSDGDLKMESDDEEEEVPHFNNPIKPKEAQISSIQPIERLTPELKAQPSIPNLNKTMTFDEINEKMSEIENNKNISEETRNNLLNILDEQINRIAQKRLDKPTDIISTYLAPQDSKKVVEVPSETNNPKKNLTIKPIQTILNVSITPDKKVNEYSLSFDSNHSHLFAKPNQPINNQPKPSEPINDSIYFNSPMNKVSSFLDGIESSKKSSNQNLDLGKYFNLGNSKVNELNDSRLAKMFMSEDSGEKNQNNNQESNNIMKERMSAITEKTIENTRNSSDISLDKLFKS